MLVIGSITWFVLKMAFRHMFGMIALEISIFVSSTRAIMMMMVSMNV